METKYFVRSTQDPNFKIQIPQNLLHGDAELDYYEKPAFCTWWKRTTPEPQLTCEEMFFHFDVGNFFIERETII